MLKGKTPLLIAGVLGILGALLSYQAIHHQQERAREGWNLVPVLVVNQDVMEGTQVTYDTVARSSMPEQFVTPSVMTPAHFEKVVGQRFNAPLQRGDLVLWNHFRSADTFQRLSSMVSRPGRAISLGFGGAKGVAGWVRPADHVDILGTFTDPKNGQTISVTLMENVVVLATGDTIASRMNMPTAMGEAKKYGSITLLVLPEEAEMLALASELGNLRLTLRNPSALGTLEHRTQTSLDYLLTGERRKSIDQKRKKLVPIIHPPSLEGGSGR